MSEVHNISPPLLKLPNGRNFRRGRPVVAIVHDEQNRWWWNDGAEKRGPYSTEADCLWSAGMALGTEQLIVQRIT